MLFIVDCANLQNWNKLQAKNGQTDDTSQHVITASLNGEKQAWCPKESSITTVTRNWKML